MNICNLCREDYGIEYGTEECRAKKQEMAEVIARLSGGMPPKPSSVKYVRVGREKEEQRICDDPHEGMIAVKNLNVGKAFYILADFGFGKSFFLNLINDRAKDMNFVTSTIQIPDINNLAEFPNIYCQIISNLEYPDNDVKGISTLLYKIIDHFQDMAQYKDFVRANGITGHPLRKMLQNMLKAKLSGSFEFSRNRNTNLDVDDMIDNVSNYLMGGTMEAQRLWSIGKKGFDNVRREDTIQYLVNLKKFIIEVGYSGLIIQIDEMAEAMEWSTSPGLVSQLISLHNKLFEGGELSKVMINYVGTPSKWDDLVRTGHGALIDRYNTGRLPLTELSRVDYINLLTKIIKVYECSMGSDLNIDRRDIEKFVDISIQKHRTISSLPPRDFINNPFRDEKSVIKILAEIRDGTLDFRTFIANTLETE